MGKLLFEQAAGDGLGRVDKAAQRGVWGSRQEHVKMVQVTVDLQYLNGEGGRQLLDDLDTAGANLIGHHRATVRHNEHQMKK